MEIKFRAFVKHLGQLADVLSIDFLDSEVEIYLVDRDEIRKYRFGEDEIVLLPFTGLKDKNGREIYEGDILELGIQKGILKSVVEYHSPTFCHRWINLEEAGIRGKKIEPLFWNTNIIFEVIGNVYENPELLEGTECMGK
ncbi:YopX family protein [Aeribacillus pallidus]|uniref:YopX family protein n=1 Tax=Aeribacillus composti TaxID=1868734 RepID=UPI002E23A39F|nr:YopX family protein [Aeribacillus composti]MED4488182.1 YopX family protein [Aeribacillus pallidus]